MQYRSVKGLSGFSQLGILFALFAGGFILTFFVQTIITIKMFPDGASIGNMQDGLITAIKNPKNVNYARLSQILGTFFVMFVPAVAFSQIVNGKQPFWLGINKHINGYQILLGFLIIFAANLMASPLEDISKSIIANFPDLNSWSAKLEKLYNDTLIALSHLNSWPEFILAIGIMAFLPALFEELFFRGVLQNLFTRWWKMPILAIIITSLIFSLVHTSIYLFLSRAALGFVLGLMYYKTRNIWVNVIAHFLNNAIAVSQLFYMSLKNQPLDISKLDPKVDWYFSVLALGMLVILFKLLGKYSGNNLRKIEEQENTLIRKADPFGPFSQTEMNKSGF